MLFLSRYSIQHPRSILFLAAIAVIAAAPGLIRLKLRTDGHALVPNDAPEVRIDRAIREQFGLADSIVILIRSDDPEGIYNAHTVNLIADLTARLHALEGLKPSDIFSLATEKSHRVRTGTMHFLDLLDPLPQTPAELSTLRDDVDRIRLYRGTLVSEDRKSTAIMVSVHNQEDRLAFFRRILDTLAGLGTIPEKIDVTGAPVAEALLGTHILEDLGVPARLLGYTTADPVAETSTPHDLEGLRLWIARHIGLLPIALAIMTIVFYASFRSVTAVAMIWIKMGSCLVIVFGVMGWCGVPIYLTTAVIPVILTAVGVSDEVHIFSRYAARCGWSRRPAADRSGVMPMHDGLPAGHWPPATGHSSSLMLDAMTEIWRPVTMTSVTTAFGFLSFAISPLPAVRSFGLFTAMGSMICMFWALTATPALAVLLDFLHPSRPRPSESQTGTPVRGTDLLTRLGYASTAFAKIFFLSRRRRVAVLGSFAVLLVVAAFGIRRIEIQDSWIDGFSPASRFYKVTQAFNDQFLGMHSLFVCVDTGNHKLAGTIDEQYVDHAVVRIPASGLAAGQHPSALVGHWIEFKRSQKSPPTTNPQSESGGLQANMFPHRCQVVSAAKEGSTLVIGLEKTKGSPRFSLDLKKGDQVEYTVSPQRLLQAGTLRDIKQLERFLADHPGERVGGAMGPAAYVETTNYMAYGRREESRTIPDKSEQLDYLWKWYASIRGEDRMRATADRDLSAGIISVYLKNANFKDTARLLSDIRRYERETLAPKNISLRFAGDVAVSQALIDGITRTQISSIVLSILGVFISAIAVHRSLKWGLLCALPCALAVPLVFGLMGFAHIPLGVATSMFAAMAIGIGDDYAIHFIERYRLESDLAKLGAGSTAPLLNTIHAAAPGIIVDAAGVAFGFSVMLLSQVPANARLGLMLLASIVTCLAATLLLLPALLGSRNRYEPAA
jgi:predicted RND superfamily exporter protein